MTDQTETTDALVEAPAPQTTPEELATERASELASELEKQLGLDAAADEKQSPYMRDRPFLVVEIIGAPKSGTNTCKAGWAKTPQNWDMRERISLVDRVNHSTMAKATIIIDVLNKKAVKNPYAAEMNDEKVAQHFLFKYYEKVGEGIRNWQILRSREKRASAS